MLTNVMTQFWGAEKWRCSAQQKALHKVSQWCNTQKEMSHPAVLAGLHAVQYCCNTNAKMDLFTHLKVKVDYKSTSLILSYSQELNFKSEQCFL